MNGYIIGGRNSRIVRDRIKKVKVSRPRATMSVSQWESERGKDISLLRLDR